MDKLLPSVSPNTKKKDELIKKAIMDQLANSVKGIQYAGVEESKSNKTINITEEANQLCVNLEAMFLHGLKGSLTHRFRRALADSGEKPVPNFWSPLLVISHRQIIDQITNLTQITTEVGQCRAWIRLALNDCLLSSYLMTMRQDSSSLKSYYKTEAFVRDSELLDVVQHLIEGVEAFKNFTLPFNSSLLNTWSVPSLYLAGIWSPTLKECPLAPCDDVAQCLDDPRNESVDIGSDTASMSSAMSFTSQSSGLKQFANLSEDEVLKIILSKDKQETKEQSSQNEVLTTEVKSNDSGSEGAKSVEDNQNYNVGNSLNRRSGWSSSDETHPEGPEETTVEKKSVEEKKKEPVKESKSMDTSYNALFESYNMLSGTYIRTPDIRELWQKFEDERSEQGQQIPPQENNDSPSHPELSLSKSQTFTLAAQVGIIAREIGLDCQNFECLGCKLKLAISDINVCNFTGDYFCKYCMSSEPIAIPARIIHNWDFKAYPVSQRGYNYISEIKDHPVIDFKVLNPFIYGVVEEMAHLQILRNQLNFLRAYLYTCREPVIEELQKQMWPREYMYEHIHQYSYSDLLDIPNDVLAQQLQKVVVFGREHVVSCWLCSQKGFVCEVCNKPKALFPFDIENIYRCDVCNAVFHKNCLNSTKPCPKCERKKKREELPLMDAITT